jgi:hypothetical protein
MGALEMAGYLERIVCVEAEIPIVTGLVPSFRSHFSALCLPCVCRLNRGGLRSLRKPSCYVEAVFKKKPTRTMTGRLTPRS